MQFNVENKELTVGSVEIRAIASSSVFIIGDTRIISNGSIFDTPPESLVIGPIVPLTEE